MNEINVNGLLMFEQAQRRYRFGTFEEWKESHSPSIVPCGREFIDPDHSPVRRFTAHPPDINHRQSFWDDLKRRGLGWRVSKLLFTIPHITKDRFYGHRCMSLLPAGVLICYGETPRAAYNNWFGVVYKNLYRFDESDQL